MKSGALLLLAAIAGIAPLGNARANKTMARDEIHYVGKINVNQASAADLDQVPGLSKADAARVLQARAESPILTLRRLHLSPKALRYLRTEGKTDFARIRKLPLAPVTSAEDDTTPPPTDPASNN